MSFMDKTRWAVKSKAQFMNLLLDLRLYNNGLYAILTVTEKIQFSSQLEFKATMTPMTNAIADSTGASESPSRGEGVLRG